MNKSPFFSRTSGRKLFGITPSFIASLSRRLALATLAAVGIGRSEAANYAWDPTQNGGLTGGAGTWNLASPFWYDGITNVTWPNGSDQATFGGAGGGVVMIDTPLDLGVSANAL